MTALPNRKLITTELLLRINDEDIPKMPDHYRNKLIRISKNKIEDISKALSITAIEDAEFIQKRLDEKNGLVGLLKKLRAR